MSFLGGFFWVGFLLPTLEGGAPAPGARRQSQPQDTRARHGDGQPVASGQCIPPYSARIRICLLFGLATVVSLGICTYFLVFKSDPLGHFDLFLGIYSFVLVFRSVRFGSFAFGFSRFVCVFLDLDLPFFY